MKKKIDEKQLMSLIEGAKYPIDQLDEREKKRAGCIEDRETDFPVNRMAGGDFGQTAVIVAASNSLKIQVEPAAVIATIADYVDGEENLHVHTDTHSLEDKPMGGCGYIQKVLENPLQFGLTSNQAEKIYKTFAHSKAEQAVVEGQHDAAAFVIVESDSHGLHSSDDKIRDVRQVFVFHETFVKKRQDELATLLTERGIVNLPDNMKPEQFADALKQKVARHFSLTRKKLAPDLPIKRAKISQTGEVEMKPVA